MRGRKERMFINIRSKLAIQIDKATSKEETEISDTG
jgi:hypothetical protein